MHASVRNETMAQSVQKHREGNFTEEVIIMIADKRGENRIWH